MGKGIDRPPYETYTADQLSTLDSLCHGYDVAEVKADGIWGVAEIYGTRAKIYSRHGKLKYEYRLFDNYNTRHVLHGEFMYGSEFAQHPTRKGSFYAFDCTEFNGTDVSSCSLYARRKMVEEVVSQLPAKFTAVKQYDLHLNSLSELWQTVVVEGGWEGLILKKRESPFGSGFARIKAEYEVDYVCTGFRQSLAPKYKGCMVRSITGGLYTEKGGALKDVLNVSGMSEDERVSMYKDPGKYIGRVFTVRGKGVFKSGAMRHPNYTGLHASKLPEECTLFSALSETPLEAG